MLPHHRRALLADDLFLLAHDDVSGKPRAHPRVTGLGLAGALLADLVLLGHLEIVPGRLVVVDVRPVGEALLDDVLRSVAGTPRHDLAEWLGYLAPAAPDRVAERLVAAGVLTEVRSRLGRRDRRYRPAQTTLAAAPSVRLRMLVTRAEPLAAPDTMLAGLAAACGLTQHILWDSGPGVRQYLDELVAGLPRPLRELLAATERGVANAVMARRV